jgi:hypothetical protein
MGFTVAGLGLLGVGVGFVLFERVLQLDSWAEIVTAIGLGGSSIALSPGSAGGYSPRQPMSGPTWWARSKPASQRMTLAIRL